MGKGCSRACDPERYRRRNAIERCVGWLKGCRSIATRHEKLAVNFAAMLKLAFLRQYLRILRPSDRTSRSAADDREPPIEVGQTSRSGFDAVVAGHEVPGALCRIAVEPLQRFGDGRDESAVVIYVN